MARVWCTVWAQDKAHVIHTSVRMGAEDTVYNISHCKFINVSRFLHGSHESIFQARTEICEGEARQLVL